jgi:hypothetical protein
MWDRLEASGAGAIVLPSLFEEQIEHEAFAVEYASLGNDSHHEALSYLPQLDGMEVGPDHHLDLVEDAKASAVDPGDRQPERGLARRLGALREAARSRPEPTRSSSTCTTPSPTRWCRGRRRAALHGADRGGQGRDLTCRWR